MIKAPWTANVYAIFKYVTYDAVVHLPGSTTAARCLEV